MKNSKDKNPEELERLKTHYSNERSFLSYIRTATSVLVLAVALMRFFEKKGIIYIGWGTLVLGLAIFALGVFRFFQEKHRIDEL